MRNSTCTTSFSAPFYSDIILLQPRRVLDLSKSSDLRALRRRISVHFATRWKMKTQEVDRHLPSTVVQYGRFRMTDGDTISSLYGYNRRDENHRDTSFFQYELLVDAFAHHRRKQSKMVPQTFFGQLGRIIVVTVQPTDAILELDRSTFILLDVEPCNTKLDKYGFYEYHDFTARMVIDGTGARAVVGRIKDGGKWVIVKRRGGMEHAEYTEDLDEEED